MKGGPKTGWREGDFTDNSNVPGNIWGGDVFQKRRLVVAQGISRRCYFTIKSSFMNSLELLPRMVDSLTNMKGIKKNFYSYRGCSMSLCVWAEVCFLWCPPYELKVFGDADCTCRGVHTVQRQRGITDTLALPIDKMLYMYLLCPHSEYQNNPFQSKQV
jgi:hypothetical protein